MAEVDLLCGFLRTQSGSFARPAKNLRIDAWHGT